MLDASWSSWPSSPRSSRPTTRTRPCWASSRASTSGRGPCIHLLGCPASQPQHLFGTDGNFRDVFSRVVYGARVSLLVGFAAVGVRDRHRHAHRRHRGLPRRRDRQRAHAAHGRPAGLPVAPALAIAIVTAARAGLHQRLLGHRHRVDPDLRPDHALVGAVDPRERLRDRLAALGESASGILFRRIMPNSITPLIVAGDPRHRRRGPGGRGALVPRRERRRLERRNGAR